jgi:hypothetical protein
MIGGWRELQNEELYNLYSSPSIIRIIKCMRMIWASHVAGMRENRNAYSISVGKPEGQRPLERLRCRWEDNINMDLTRNKMGYYGLD